MIENTFRPLKKTKLLTLVGILFFLVFSIFVICRLDYTIKSGFLILPFVVTGGYYILLHKAEKNYTRQYIFSFLILLITFSFISHFIEVESNQNDAIFYTEEGLKVANSLKEFSPPFFPEKRIDRLSVNLYVLWNGLVFSILGKSYFGMQIINSFFLSMALFNISRLFRVLYEVELPKTGLFGLLVYPAFYWHGTANLREPLSLFFITGSIYIGAKWSIKNEFHPIKSLVFVIGVGLTRIENLGLIMAFFGLIFFKDAISKSPEDPSKSTNSKIANYIVLISIIFFAIGFYHLILKQYDLSYVKFATLGRSRGGYSLAPRVYEAWTDLLLNNPFAGIQFLIIPAPWTFAFTYTKAYIDAFYVFIVLLISLFGFPKLWRERRYFTFALTIFILLSAYSYGIIDINAGSASRHRMQFVPLLFVFVGRVFLRKTE
jgi:hypothetical protein